ncbi:MAG: class I SAM-dependent methyltransferase [Gammaproteobacteria bacterium]|nr:class I SAM-dependent methyltransferase [Gammaproteobacteria bacterium]MDH5728129.1 class I SAM-dependent methyltransferase [Gammaproteobacteria bacterium]
MFSKSRLKSLYTAKQPCGDAQKVRQHLREWVGHGLGAALAHEERRQLEQVLPTLFGYYLLELGYLGNSNYLNVSYIRNKYSIDLDINSNQLDVQIYADPGALGIASDSVDLVVLPHTLELHHNPHQVLREVERVLVPEGHVVILGFNPWSLWGIRKLFSWRKKEVPWCAKFISPMRMRDWLALLDMDLVTVNTFFYRPPLRNARRLRRMSKFDSIGEKLWPAFGGAYLFVAKKRVATFTALGPKWRKRKQVLTPGFLETRQ